MLHSWQSPVAGKLYTSKDRPVVIVTHLNEDECSFHENHQFKLQANKLNHYKLLKPHSKNILALICNNHSNWIYFSVICCWLWLSFSRQPIDRLRAGSSRPSFLIILALGAPRRHLSYLQYVAFKTDPKTVKKIKNHEEKDKYPWSSFHENLNP